MLVAPNQGTLTNGEDEIPASAITLAETMKTAGYVTAHFGKYHVGGNVNNDPTVQGFDYNYGGNFSGTPGNYFAAQNNNRVWRFGARIGAEMDTYASPYTAAQSQELAGDNSLDGTPKHITDAMAEAAFDFMNANSGSRFFMHFSSYAVHTPTNQANARADLYAKYAAKTPSQMGHDNIGQAAILEGMDQTIGRLIDYLNTTPDPRNLGHMLSENTLVYFTSDNGGMNGPEDNQPLSVMKGEYTEGGIRATCFVWSQGLLANMGTVNNTPIQAFDVYPTFAQMGNATLPSGYAVNAQRDQRPVSVIRKGQYKLTYFYETESYEMYDLDTDLPEADDLLDNNPSNAILTIASDLSTDLRNYLIDVAAPLPTYRSTGVTVDLPEVISVNNGGGDGTCTTITVNSEDFEAGWGIWNNGGSDCRRNANDAFDANTGTYCIRLRDDTDTSVTTTDAFDASNYESITVDFSYYCSSMDNVNEDFWLQISTDDGATFTTVREWKLNTDFNNDTRYFDQYEIVGTFSSTTKLRFRADASGNSDWVYLDDIVISACESASPRTDTTDDIVKDTTDNSLLYKTSIVAFPNPFDDTIQFDIQEDFTKANISLYNILGQRVFSGEFTNQDMIRIVGLNLESGQYFAQINLDGKITTKKLSRR